MKLQSLFLIIFSQLVLASPARLERRKSFVETHQEHGHLPGGENNPGIMAIIPQLMAMLTGESFSSVLNGYNQRSDVKSGRTGSSKSGNGMLESLGFGDIPIIGKMI